MDQLLDPKRAKAAGIYAVVAAVVGAIAALVALVSPTAAGVVVIAAVAGHWGAGQLIARRNGEVPDVLDGAVELAHRARLELDELAHRMPEYREAAGYLELAEDAIARASSTGLTVPPSTEASRSADS
jgi:hypothetical protein